MIQNQLFSDHNHFYCGFVNFVIHMFMVIFASLEQNERRGSSGG